MFKNNPLVSGYILAGGKSARLGRDKRQVRIFGATLLQRTILTLEAATGAKPVLVGDNLPAEGIYGCVVISDAARDKGPIAGLVSALNHCRTRWAAILPVDLPFVTAGEVQRLIALASEELDAVLFASKGKLEPLAALYNVRTRDFWRGRLERGELSLQEGIKRLNHRAVEALENSRTLFNLNTPRELEKMVEMREINTGI